MNDGLADWAVRVRSVLGAVGSRSMVRERMKPEFRPDRELGIGLQSIDEPNAAVPTQPPPPSLPFSARPERGTAG